jgi:hypothetical protein
MKDMAIRTNAPSFIAESPIRWSEMKMLTRAQRRRNLRRRASQPEYRSVEADIEDIEYCDVCWQELKWHPIDENDAADVVGKEDAHATSEMTQSSQSEP